MGCYPALVLFLLIDPVCYILVTLCYQSDRFPVFRYCMFGIDILSKTHDQKTEDSEMKHSSLTKGFPSVYQLVFVIFLVALFCLVNCALAQPADIDQSINDELIAVNTDSISFTTASAIDVHPDLISAAAEYNMILNRNEIEFIPLRSYYPESMTDRLIPGSGNSLSNAFRRDVLVTDPENEIQFEDWMLDPHLFSRGIKKLHKK